MNVILYHRTFTSSATECNIIPYKKMVAGFPKIYSSYREVLCEASLLYWNFKSFLHITFLAFALGKAFLFFTAIFQHAEWP